MREADEARALKHIPPIETVRLSRLTAADGRAYVGVALEYHAAGGEPTVLEFGLSACDAAALGEKLGATEH